ncbi:tetratricopeptide repeat protein [Sphingomonas aliaeris]|uniref:Tetratricopeptide repeat protein n=1 Tax=Sphingomonas aliaeris TaxID=2759526 RepID=A0A974NVG8_9SPHN|nr:tetratricopeptide repeat protein [Sphingomonas aliaeris]
MHRGLERYPIPKRLRGRETPVGVLGKRLPPVFQDREELAASTDLAQSVRAALHDSATLIVICSPNSRRSRWVNEEIREFIRLGRRDRIKLIVVDGTPAHPDDLPEDGGDGCFPPALFEGGAAEPLAADVRPGADGPRGALLKVIAGSLGVEYDELRQRDQARRQKQLAIIASAAMLGFVVMTGLTVMALISRKEAVEQRDLARKRTATAERTVEFVQSLFEVSDPSEAQGAKITAKEVLDKGAVRITGALANEPDVKAQLMTTLSQVYLGLGSYRTGDQIIRQSMALPITEPAVRARQFIALGGSQIRQSEYPAAVRNFDKAIALSRTASNSDPQLLPQALVGRAEARTRLEDYPGADADAKEALRLDHARAGDRDPTVARDLEAIGYNLLTAGKLAPARQRFEQALGIRVATQGLAHPKVSDVLNELGSIAYLQRDSVAAERFWLRALRSDELVLGPNHPYVAVTINNVARVQLEGRAFASARTLLRRASAITLAQQSETYDDLAFTFANLAIAERGLGNTKEAETLLRKAWRAAALHKHRNRAPILTELADLLCARGDHVEGLALLDQALPLMRADYPDDPWRLAWIANTRGDACWRRSVSMRRAS